MTDIQEAIKRDDIVQEFRDEYIRASKLFHNFHSPHEGYAVILEELDELWDEIRNGEDKERMKKEAIQIGAMALRFIMNIT